VFRRRLTKDEKRSARAGFRADRRHAFELARKERGSAERLAIGIHKTELMKLEAKIRTELAALDAKSWRRQKVVDTAIRARDRALLNRRSAFTAAARAERNARNVATRTYRETCKSLRTATISDYVATASAF
jgi:hypothetical protein